MKKLLTLFLLLFIVVACCSPKKEGSFKHSPGDIVYDKLDDSKYIILDTVRHPELGLYYEVKDAEANYFDVKEAEIK